MRYEQTVQRAMSVCRLSRGEDSDDGNWSENSDESPVQRVVPRRLRSASPPMSPCVFQRPSAPTAD